MFCQHCGAKRLDVRGPCQACGRQSSGVLGDMLVSPDEIIQEGSCSNCGTSLAGDEMFCGECGANLIHQADTPPEGAPAPSPPALLPSRMPLLVGLLCFVASLLSGGTAIWLAVGR